MNFLFGSGNHNNSNLSYLNNNVNNSTLNNWIEEVKKRLQNRIKKYSKPSSFAILEFSEDDAIKFSNWAIMTANSNESKLERFLGDFPHKENNYEFLFTLYDLGKTKNLVGFGLFGDVNNKKKGFKTIDVEDISSLSSNVQVFSFGTLPKVHVAKSEKTTKNKKATKSNKSSMKSLIKELSSTNKPTKSQKQKLEKLIKETTNKKNKNDLEELLDLMNDVLKSKSKVPMAELEFYYEKLEELE